MRNWLWVWLLLALLVYAYYSDVGKQVIEPEPTAPEPAPVVIIATPDVIVVESGSIYFRMRE